jgi:hypothetical protein
VPGGVTVHVNDEDGDVDIETPTSLQVIFLKLYQLFSKVSIIFPRAFKSHALIYSGGLISIHTFLNKRSHWNAHNCQERPFLFLVGGGIAF